MSAYGNDPRVVLNADGSARIPDPADYEGERSGDWVVRRSGAGFEVHNEGGDQGFVYDEGAWYASRQRVPKVFATVDEAIADVIGVPQVAA